MILRRFTTFNRKEGGEHLTTLVTGPKETPCYTGRGNIQLRDAGESPTHGSIQQNHTSYLMEVRHRVRRSTGSLRLSTPIVF